LSKYVVFATWLDVPHLSEEAKASLEASFTPAERAARTKGIPSLGAGAIYPVVEDDITCEPFIIPAYYKHAFGFDVGWKRTAAIFGALDPETDILYLYSEYYRGEVEPPIHAEAIRGRGKWIPGVIDPAANGRSQKDGSRLIDSYREYGLNLTNADNSVSDGINKIWTRLSSGRLKVFTTCTNWLNEFRIYRRDEKGKIVKSDDHLMDATRYLVNSGLTIAALRPYDEWQGRPGALPRSRSTRMKVDFDPYPDPTAHLSQSVH
jgi:hypothetical protein